jgi:lipoate-protein ligase A
MMKMMTPPKEKFDDKSAKSIAERVIYLEQIVGREIDIREVRHISVEAMGRAFDVKLVPGELTEREKKLLDEYRRKYSTEEWFF